MLLVTGFGTRLTAKAGTTVSGTDITGWMDQVTGTRNLTVPTGETAPQASEQLNAVDVLSFSNNALQINDGLNQRESNTAGNALMIYIVIKSPLAGFGYVLDAASAQDRQGVLHHGNPSRYGGRVGSNAFYGEATANEWAALTVVHTQSGFGSPSKIYLNGALIVEDATFGMAFGTGLTIGASGSLVQNGTFTVAEVVEYYDVVEHTQADIEQNVAYFETEWGLDLLPSPIAGTITYETGALAGQPVEGARVFYFSADNADLDNLQVLQQVTTGVDGKHELTVDPPAGKTLAWGSHYNAADGSKFGGQIKIPNSFL